MKYNTLQHTYNMHWHDTQMHIGMFERACNQALF